MSIWDRMSRQSTPVYDESALSTPGIQIIGSWQASELRGRFTATGGRLVLTDGALIFSPLDLEGTKQVLKLLLSVAQMPGEQVLTELADSGRKVPLVIALTNIASAGQTGVARLLTPPSFRLTTKIGSVYEFGVLAGIMYPNRSAENEAALADFLSKLKAQLAAQGPAA